MIWDLKGSWEAYRVSSRPDLFRDYVILSVHKRRIGTIVNKLFEKKDISNNQILYLLADRVSDYLERLMKIDKSIELRSAYDTADELFLETAPNISWTMTDIYAKK